MSGRRDAVFRLRVGVEAPWARRRRAPPVSRLGQDRKTHSSMVSQHRRRAARSGGPGKYRGDADRPCRHRRAPRRHRLPHVHRTPSIARRPYSRSAPCHGPSPRTSSTRKAQRPGKGPADASPRARIRRQRRNRCDPDPEFANGLLHYRRQSQKWCGWSGSNRHSLRNGILSPARLPVSPHPHGRSLVAVS